jgi:hypothetical protein
MEALALLTTIVIIANITCITVIRVLIPRTSSDSRGSGRSSREKRGMEKRSEDNREMDKGSQWRALKHRG